MDIGGDETGNVCCIIGVGHDLLCFAHTDTHSPTYAATDTAQNNEIIIVTMKIVIKFEKSKRNCVGAK